MDVNPGKNLEATLQRETHGSPKRIMNIAPVSWCRRTVIEPRFPAGVKEVVRVKNDLDSAAASSKRPIIHSRPRPPWVLLRRL